MINYTKELHELIERQRAKGLQWREVSKIIAEETGEIINPKTLNNRYMEHANDQEFETIRVNELLSKSRRSQLAAVSARSDLKNTLDGAIRLEDLLDSTKKLFKSLNNVKIPKLVLVPPNKGTKCRMTVEALFSDLQIGKLSPDFNLEIAKKRIEAYTDAIILKIDQHKKSGYQIEKVVVAFLGDIIESMDKAIQKGDATSCEVDTPEQVRLAVEWLWRLVIVPIYQLNIPVHLIGIPGNHDHISAGMKMYKAGKNQISWIIYKQIALLCEAANMNNICFDITEGVFTTYEYYGHIAVYEHGYGITPTVKNLQLRLNDRIRQLRKFCTYFRMGDKHSITRFVEDTLIVNGAFFGSTIKDKGEEYSSVQGFSSNAAQLVLFHIPRHDNRNTIFDSFVIQLGHVR